MRMSACNLRLPEPAFFVEWGLLIDSPAWATSGALHVYETSGRAGAFVLASNGTEVLSMCGDRNTARPHRLAAPLFHIPAALTIGCGCSPPDGKEIGPLGETTRWRKTLARREAYAAGAWNRSNRLAELLDGGFDPRDPVSRLARYNP